MPVRGLESQGVIEGTRGKYKPPNIQPRGHIHEALLAVISKPKNVCLSAETKKIIVKFGINYHPCAIKLSISASGHKRSRPVWIET